MKYFIDTEFIEGSHQPSFFLSNRLGKLVGAYKKPTIDLISIGIVSENFEKTLMKPFDVYNETVKTHIEYYAISKDFNLKEAWNRYDLKPDINNGGFKKEYWIRENVLKLIFVELSINNLAKDYKGVKSTTAYGIYFHEEVEKLLKQDFTYKNLRKLINKYGKTNKQIAEEIKDFIYKTATNLSFQSTENQIKYWEKEVPIEFYGYYADYDWVVFCWLFGKMVDLPKGFSKYCIDLKQELDRRFPNGKYGTTVVIPRLVNGTLLADLPPKTKYKEINIKEHPNYPKQTNLHNALADAKWIKELYNFLNNL